MIYHVCSVLFLSKLLQPLPIVRAVHGYSNMAYDIQPSVFGVPSHLRLKINGDSRRNVARLWAQMRLGFVSRCGFSIIK